MASQCVCVCVGGGECDGEGRVGVGVCVHAHPHSVVVLVIVIFALLDAVAVLLLLVLLLRVRDVPLWVVVRHGLGLVDLQLGTHKNMVKLLLRGFQFKMATVQGNTREIQLWGYTGPSR